MGTSDASTIITSILTDISTVLQSGLTAVLGVLAVLIGLFFILRFIYKKIGRAKG